jgi:peptidoglycan/LPS O-acetylase OafA/YrhL
MMPAGTTPFPRLLAALAVVGSASTITVVAMGAAGSARTLVVAATVTAAQAFLAGGLLVAAGRRGGPVATFQTMMGAASLVLGVGAVVLLIEQLSRPQVGYPTSSRSAACRSSSRGWRRFHDDTRPPGRAPGCCWRR